MLSILFFFLPFFFLSFTGRQSAGYFHFPTEGENSGFLHWSDVLCYFLPLGHSDHGFESHVKYSCTNLSMLHLCCAVLVEAWSVLISNPESYWMSVSGFINPEMQEVGSCWPVHATWVGGMLLEIPSIKQALKVTLNIQTCLTPAEQMIKKCVKSLAGNYWCCLPDGLLKFVLRVCIVCVSSSGDPFW